MTKQLFGYVFVLISLVTVNACEKSEEPCQEQIWYEDLDGNGLGNPNANVKACEQPMGYVSNADEPAAPQGAVIPNSGFSSPMTYSGMKLIWADEFNDDVLNESFWNIQTGDGCPDLCGWGNQELQSYQAANISFKEGNLVITAKSENVGARNYTSSRINTKGKVAFKYGRVDVRAATPYGKGMWPAIWMLGENIDEVGWPKCGEIDIMEMVGGEETKTYGTVHWDNNGSYANYGGKKENILVPLNAAYHVFSITWDQDFIRWYIDNEEYHVIDITPTALSEFREDFHLLINVAVGGLFSGNPDSSTSFPQYMVVDYVRVFQKDN